MSGKLLQCAAVSVLCPVFLLVFKACFVSLMSGKLLVL